MLSPRRDWPLLSSFAFFLVLSCGVALTAPALAASEIHVLHRFQGDDGQFPYYGNLVLDAGGNLYGTTYNGGDFLSCGYGCGTVFRLTLQNGQWTHTVLHEFHNDGQDGYNPLGPVAIDEAGNVLGTTTQGGAKYGGTVFMLVPNGDGSYRETIIYNFCSGYNCLEGAGPAGGVTIDAKGNLYGTASWGGNVFGGVVFELVRSRDWKYKVIYSLLGSYNGHSYSTVTFDGAGNLYGTAIGGSCFSGGTVFRLTPRNHDEWYYKLLYKFTPEGTDGACPYSGVILDARGNVYGATVHGGAYDAGVVYQLTPRPQDLWKETVLHSFDFNDGAEPYGGLLWDASGNLYGTLTAGGKNGLGSVFKLTLSSLAGGAESASETILLNFNGKNGIFPYAGLVFDGQGNLYGTTYYGGNLSDCNYQGCGVVFQLTP